VAISLNNVCGSDTNNSVKLIERYSGRSRKEGFTQKSGDQAFVPSASLEKGDYMIVFEAKADSAGKLDDFFVRTILFRASDEVVVLPAQIETVSGSASSSGDAASKANDELLNQGG
jgi:hypothetical protein